MSVRAYRVIKKEVADQNSFNIWHDIEIMDFLKDQEDVNIDDRLNMDGCGEFDLPVSALKALLAQNKIEIGDYQRQAIQEDIDFAKTQAEDYVMYECY